MARVDFSAARKTAEKEGHIAGGDYFKFKDGANRVRLVSECLPHPGEYNGTPNFKWLCYALDRTDGQVKTWFMPHTIYKAIESLQQTDDYAFDEVPMPYDITINVTGAGTKEAKYNVVPARKNTALTAAEISLIDGKKNLSELQLALRSKTGDKSEVFRTSAPAFDPDEVPF